MNYTQTVKYSFSRMGSSLKVKKAMKTFFWMIFGLCFLTSCTVVRQGEVGVKRKLGTYNDQPYTQGLQTFNPFTSTIIKVPIQTENMEVSLALPSKEGLNVRAAISILYNIQPDAAPEILRNIGLGYENNVILPVFRSAVADVTAQFFAKDMHTGERSTIEKAIQERMTGMLEGRGINVEAVLIKSIQLPDNLYRAIEEKLEAEQRALRMQFVLQEAEQEAQRRRIEAEGVRDAQSIISEGLNPQILQFKSIEAFLKLAESPNTKIIISDGDMPMLMDSEPTGTNSSRTSIRNQ
jgi:prohibitin 1